MHHARQKTEERAGEEKGRRRQLFMRNDKMNLNMRNVSPSRCLFLSHNKCKKGQKLKLIKINESHTSDRRENTGSRGGQRCSCRKVRGMERGGGASKRSAMSRLFLPSIYPSLSASLCATLSIVRAVTLEFYGGWVISKCVHGWRGGSD